MLKAPSQPYDRKTSAGVIGPYQQAVIPAGAFGGDIIKGVDKLGAGLLELGDELMFNMQDQPRVDVNQDLAELSQQANIYEEQSRKKNTGRNAFAVKDDVGGFYRKGGQQLIDKYADNARAQNYIEQWMQVGDMELTQRGLEYANQQAAARNKEIAESLLGDSEKVLGDCESSPQQRELARLKMKLFWDDCNSRVGVDASQLRATLDETFAGAERKRADGWLAKMENDPQTGLQEMEEYAKARQEGHDVSDSPLHSFAKKDFAAAQKTLKDQLEYRRGLSLHAGRVSLNGLKGGLYGMNRRAYKRHLATMERLATVLDKKEYARLQAESEDIKAVARLLDKKDSFAAKRATLEKKHVVGAKTGDDRRVKQRLAILEEACTRFSQDPAAFVRSKVDADVDMLMQIAGFTEDQRPMLRAELSKQAIAQLSGVKQEMACLLSKEEAAQLRARFSDASRASEKQAIEREVFNSYGPEYGKLVLTQVRQSSKEQTRTLLASGGGEAARLSSDDAGMTEEAKVEGNGQAESSEKGTAIDEAGLSSVDPEIPQAYVDEQSAKARRLQAQGKGSSISYQPKPLHDLSQFVMGGELSWENREVVDHLLVQDGNAYPMGNSDHGRDAATVALDIAAGLLGKGKVRAATWQPVSELSRWDEEKEVRRSAARYVASLPSGEIILPIADYENLSEEQQNKLAAQRIRILEALGLVNKNKDNKDVKGFITDNYVEQYRIPPDLIDKYGNTEGN